MRPLKAQFAVVYWLCLSVPPSLPSERMNPITHLNNRPKATLPQPCHRTRQLRDLKPGQEIPTKLRHRCTRLNTVSTDTPDDQSHSKNLAAPPGRSSIHFAARKQQRCKERSKLNITWQEWNGEMQNTTHTGQHRLLFVTTNWSTSEMFQGQQHPRLDTQNTQKHACMHACIVP